jgi:hypothetical protein
MTSRKFQTLPVVLSLLTTLAGAKTSIVRVFALDYEELYRHIRFKGSSIEIASASPGEHFDLIADQADIELVIGCGLRTEVVVEDVEHERELARQSGRGKARPTAFGQYRSYAEIVTILRGLASSFPDICRLDSFGPTHQNRWSYGLKISDNPGLDEDEPEVLIVGVHHAREWASAEVPRYIADTLIRNCSTNVQFRDFINSHELWIFPVVNVDGYIYDYPNQYWWRKNRQPFGSAIGSDPNRGYNGACNGDRFGDWGAVAWNSSTTHYPSSNLFFGARGEWAREIRYLADFFRTRSFVGVLSFHLYGELVLWPYAYGPHPRDSSYYVNLGRGIAGQIRRLGSGYYTPEHGGDLYPTNCDSDGWMYGWSHYINGVPCMSYTIELGTTFYQPVSDLDFIQQQAFRGAWYHMVRSDTTIAQLEGQVPRPFIAPMDSGPGTFTLHWTPVHPEHNHPTRWELQELRGLTVTTDSLESGSSRWSLVGASLSTARSHSGNYSLFFGSGNNISNYAMTAHPYPVQPGDSLVFWIWYSLENNYDVGIAEVSLEGKEWFQLHDRYTGSSSGWVRRAYPLEPWAGRSVFIRFRYMTDDNTLGTGMYVDDVHPVPMFADSQIVSSSITDTSYQIGGRSAGRYFYRVRGYNTAWAWGDRGPLEDYRVLMVDDVAAVGILGPSGAVDSGSVHLPRALVANFGSLTASFPVVFRIGSTYADTQSVAELNPGDTATVSFKSWTAEQRGAFTLVCSTMLAGDAVPENDSVVGRVTVSAHDVGVKSCSSPVSGGEYRSGDTIRPAATWHNYGSSTADFEAWVLVSDPARVPFYSRKVDVAGLAAGSDTVVSSFPYLVLGSEGNWAFRCSTYMADDAVPDNDTLDGGFRVERPGPQWPHGWVEVSSVPLPPSGKPVKRGGWLEYDRSTGLLYGQKGYKTNDFYFYNPLADVWMPLTGMPFQTHPVWASKPPRKGSKGVSDGDNTIYVTQGNNTLGFWSYHIAEDSWAKLEDVPLGMYRKKVKGGTDMAYVPGMPGYVYLLKGYKNEFYRYNTVSGEWETLPNAPVGVRLKWDKGSWLCPGPQPGAPDMPVLYAHKAKYHELWRFDLATQRWDSLRLTGMPYIGQTLRRKKSKDGGSAALQDGRIFAFKGGNTQEFWMYDPATDQWTELDTIPAWGSSGRKKRVKYGADIASYGDGAFFALKGNKTSEVWRYVMPYAAGFQPKRSGIMAEAVKTRAAYGFELRPNPLVDGIVTVTWQFADAPLSLRTTDRGRCLMGTVRQRRGNPGAVAIKVFDVAGRTVSHTWSLGHSVSGSLSLDLRSLAAGIYLVRLDADGFTSSQKLVIDH